MTSKVVPCVTVMFCAAGCSTNTSQVGPEASIFVEPMPTQGDLSSTPKSQQSIERAASPRKVSAGAAPKKPVVVTVPIDVLMTDTAVPAAPDTAAAAPQVHSHAIPKFDAPASASTVPKSVVAPPVAIDAARDVVSRGSGHPSEAALTLPITHRPSEGWRRPKTTRPAQTPIARTEMPRARPPLNSPEPSKLPPPLGDVERFSALPPRPVPSPSQPPAEPAPRRPMRLPVEPTVMTALRDGRLSVSLPAEARRLPDSESAIGDALPPSGRALGNPPPLGDEAPVQMLYRLKIEDAPAPAREATNQSFVPAPFPRIAEQPPRAAFLQIDAVPLPELPNDAPPPEMPRVRLDAILRAPVEISASKSAAPANDPGKPALCAVHRGAGNVGADPRMILVCEGEDVSRADMLRAVIEGESAFRALRPFDAPAISTEKFGLDADRFAAIADKPRSADDLAFLRDLRDTRQELRLKGRHFHLYRIKGHRGTATVLVETQITLEDTPPLPAAVNQ